MKKNVGNLEYNRDEKMLARQNIVQQLDYVSNISKEHLKLAE